MITASQLLGAIQFHNTLLPPGAVARWAFMVSQDELDALVDEFQSTPLLGLQLDEKAAADIKSGKAGLNLNGTWVLPNTGLPSSPGIQH